MSKLEEHLMGTAGDWAATTVTGDFSSQGFPQLKFRVTRSENLSDGGIPGDLMAITSTAWSDTNNNNTWDSGEPRCVFATKLAHVVAYELEADES
jgi:hypothetical protein